MTVSNLPFWYILIDRLKRQKVISNGATIPYIIGAYELVDKSFLIDGNSINYLLTDIVNSSTEQVAVIQLCPDIHQFVVGLDNKQFCEIYFKKEKSFTNSSNEKTLYITQNASNLGASIADIIKNLEDKYLSRVKERAFSWDNYKNEWRPFNKKEEKDIKTTPDLA